MEIKEQYSADKRSLQIGTCLYNRYQIEEVLGEGGFGITYMAKELESNTRVAIKEYFPADLATRMGADSDQNLHIFRGENEAFERGKKRFLKEAGILRKFHYLEGIVPVLDCFESNQTAYIVMEHIEGITLKQYVKENGKLSFNELVLLLEPVMKSLIKIHNQGLIHKDISPDNLMIGMDNRIRLIDFGAAQSANEKYKKVQTVILKAGYAPPEQYLVDGKQGPWTDVYALTATMYMALTGKKPLDSVARLQGKETLDFGSCVGDLKWWQKEAIEQGMNVKVSKRFKNIEEFLEALTICPSDENGVTVHRVSAQGREKALITKTDSQSGTFIRNVVVLLCLSLGGLGLYWGIGRESSVKPDIVPSTQLDSEEWKTDEQVAEPELCKVPSVLNLSEMDAKEKIYAVDSDISIRIIRVYNSEVEKGFVILQSVEPDTLYNKGAIEEIVLTVSDGEEVSNAATPKNNSSNNDNVKKSTMEKFNVVEEEDGYDEFKIED